MWLECCRWRGGHGRTGDCVIRFFLLAVCLQHMLYDTSTMQLDVMGLARAKCRLIVCYERFGWELMPCGCGMKLALLHQLVYDFVYGSRLCGCGSARGNLSPGVGQWLCFVVTWNSTQDKPQHQDPPAHPLLCGNRLRSILGQLMQPAFFPYLHSLGRNTDSCRGCAHV